MTAIIAVLFWLPFADGKPAFPLKRCLIHSLATLKISDPQAYRDMLGTHEGLRIYNEMLDCKEKDQMTTSSFHEGLHGFTAVTDSYPLYDGRRIHQLQNIRFAPSEILPWVGTTHSDVMKSLKEEYMRRGGSDSWRDYHALLDELNAYSRQLIATVRLNQHGFPQEDIWASRQQVAGMMWFLKLTVMKAKSHPEDWKRLNSSAHRELLTAIWAQGETALTLSCHSAMVQEDLDDNKKVLHDTYDSKYMQPLAQLIGRTPQPIKCQPSVLMM